jgi:alkanesulfonate monooxygenase SsuD/methylene tetrahydromethanopterin reductase-like flavin-dependent oxidoreductase (luciferase family)
MRFGLGLMGYHGCWEDAAFAEKHGFSSAGFVDSPLLGGETFACMALAANTTTTMRLGSLLAIPSSRSAPTTAQGIATVNRLAPGRTFLALGTGFTSRSVFGLPPVPIASFAAFAQECRGLLSGEEVMHDGKPVRFRQREGDYIELEQRTPVYIGADAPKALRVAGETGDGWVCSLMFANVMENAAEVFASSFATVKEAARGAGRDLEGAEAIWSTTLCVLEPGERATDPRVLERVGAHAMMPFHAYADNPETAEFLPPPIQARLSVYRSEVLERLGVGPERLHQETHRGHLSHLLEGEARVLTDEIVKMTTLTGSAEEIVGSLQALEAAGLTDLALWFPPRTTRYGVREVAVKLMPLL